MSSITVTPLSGSFGAVVSGAQLAGAGLSAEDARVLQAALAERLKSLMERQPIYTLKAGEEISPLLESPLGLFDPEQMGDMLEERFGIPRRRLTGLMSPWAVKRLDGFGGDVSKFVFPSVERWLREKIVRLGG